MEFNRVSYVTKTKTKIKTDLLNYSKSTTQLSQKSAIALQIFFLYLLNLFQNVFVTGNK